MRENDEITGLFRKRLAGAEMTVREGFWEKLQEDLPVTSPVPAESKAKMLFSPRFYRVAAAASVLFVLGAASAAFWYFSPKEEIKEAFTQVSVLTPEGSLNGDVVQESFPSIHQEKIAEQKPGKKHPASGASAVSAVPEEDDESLSVHVSITITQRVYGNQQQTGDGFYDNRPASQSGGGYQVANNRSHSDSDAFADAAGDGQDHRQKHKASRKWALKAVLGTSLPKGDYHMPLTAGVTVERSLNKRLALETGILYNRLHSDLTLHTLQVPLKLNVMLASASKVDLYATVGGAVEKCIAGAADNGFGAEPVQLSVAAGLGVRYKLNDRFALFAEPSVSHHFDTDSRTKTLRTERPVNLNLLCGVRMTY